MITGANVLIFSFGVWPRDCRLLTVILIKPGGPPRMECRHSGAVLGEHYEAPEKQTPVKGQMREGRGRKEAGREPGLWERGVVCR
ncbi:hypothetical protein C0Q70_01072 [Pomacea canaliculata]|uniref:Uncharacterized protein n=1 Tax=Pomacea canaliculata TaxID=400727 RepID=A0A2T7PYI3_POMCA|nr:hypothetical protein C0Q70_01072 [Pomacea canaliculata]